MVEGDYCRKDGELEQCECEIPAIYPVRASLISLMHTLTRGHPGLSVSRQGGMGN